MTPPPTVWIYQNPYPDGPVRLIRATTATRIVQDEGTNHQVYVNGDDVVWGAGGGVSVPPGFALALAQALDTARHAAIDQDHDQVVTARVQDGQWVWKVYRIDNVPESPNPKPEHLTTSPSPNGAFVPNPHGSMPLWVDKPTEPQGDTVPE
ncbi:hypothetical protein ABT034_31630 [Streptomyces sp. NPDC002773]|uniref:hypothetical protein n=1 Tax=Streptomyces sp. NPDC002773 TaxID=3154430 RepID=UPI00332BFBE8